MVALSFVETSIPKVQHPSVENTPKRPVPLMSLRQPAHNWMEKGADGVTTGLSRGYYPIMMALDSVAESKNGVYQTGSASTSLVRSYAYRQSVMQLAKAEGRFLKNHPKVLEWVNNHPWWGGVVMTTLVLGPSLLVSEGAGLLSAPLAKKVESFVWKHIKGTWAGRVLQTLWKRVYSTLKNKYVLMTLLAILLGTGIVRAIRHIREARDFKRAYQAARKEYPMGKVDPLTLRYAVMMAKLKPQQSPA